MSLTCNKQERKAFRRQTKYKHLLLNETGIQHSNLPSRFLMVGNAGLVTGLKHEQLLKLCNEFGPIENIVMLPMKSYCFVAFQDVESASKAYNNLHGKVNFPYEDSGFLYFIYSERVPDVPHIWDFTWKPPGLLVMEEFVTKDEEEILLNCIDWSESDTSRSLKHRRVTHYGYEFRYDTNNVDKDKPLPRGLPEECSFVFDRLNKNESGVQFSQPNQLTVNQYQPGQGIPPHVDTHSAFQDPILSLSLGSDVVMDFKHSGQAVSVCLPRRSLLIMGGESRFAWTHGITPRSSDIVPISGSGLTIKHRGVRTSFTFRTVLKGECNCQYHDQCDSYQRKNAENKSNLDPNETASKLESTHVHDVYEEIANHFSDTRHKPWPNVLEFVNDLKVGSVLVDVGCGNGKYFGSNLGIFELGCDRSFGLAKVCNSRGHQVFNCNCLSLPIKDATADGCISIAVIHHLASAERRLKAIEEIVRILRPKGKALIYVWAKDQERHKSKSSYLKQDRKNRKVASDTNPPDSPSVDNVINTSDASVLGQKCETSLPIHTNRTQFKHKDLLVPWKIKPNKKKSLSESTNDDDNVQATANDETVPTFLRYYHVFDEGELEELCSTLENIQIIKNFYDQGNWCVVLEKL